MKNKYVSAIIVAAGNSTRMGKDKIFIDLNSIPVIAHTLLAFQNADVIGEIIIVCKNDDIKKLEDIINKYSINKFKRFALGGSTRQESVFSGIKKCDEKTSYYAIHDAARCLITSDEINNVVYDSFHYKASSLGVPCKDTLKILNDNNIVVSTPARSSLWAIQTPQVFEKNLYQDAMHFALKTNQNYTDDCQLIENYRQPVHIVTGNYSNLKITTPDDIVIFENILNLRSCK